MKDLSQTSDNDLLRRIMAGDEIAFRQIYRRRQGAIYRFALQMSGSRQIAEDVTQDAFLALVSEPRNFDPRRGSLVSYLYGIARNRTLQYLEQGRLHVSLAPEAGHDAFGSTGLQVETSDPLAYLTKREDVERLQEAILALPFRYREVVVMCDLHEMDYAQAAATIGCALGTVRSRLHRARNLLLRKIQASSAGVVTPAG